MGTPGPVVGTPKSPVTPIPSPEKRPCPDCHFCQHCGETRCQICRNTKRKSTKRSFADQIALYNERNKGLF